MDCTCCGMPAGYNRVVVDLISGRKLDGFCRNCEYESFGHALSKFDSPDDSCVLCNRDGHYAVPAWEPYEETSDRRTTCHVAVTIHERTPVLCDEHFHDLCASEEETPTAARRFSR